jgi:CubicO group peptidase (beta-lactamase class C family)
MCFLAPVVDSPRQTLDVGKQTACLMTEPIFMKITAQILVAILSTFMSLPNVRCAAAGDLPRVTSEDVGLSSDRLAHVTQLLRNDVGGGNLPGAVLLISRHGKIAYFESVGVLDPETKAPMTKDAIFRIYAMSKPITTLAAMILYEDGKIALDEPIAKYLPEFKDMKVGVESTDATTGKPKLELVSAKRAITIQDLMRHTSGFTYGFFGGMLVKKAYSDAGLRAGDFTNAEFADRLAKLPLAFQPGTTWDYSHSTDILGRLIEVISGQSLYQFEKEHVLDPLGMTDTSFYVVDKEKHDRIAEPFKSDQTFGVGIEYKDPRLAVKWESGGGGMVSTAMDYARFLQMLLDGGSLDGKRYLGPKTVAYMTSDHLGDAIARGPYYFPGPGYGFGLGFAVRKEAGVAATAGSPGEYFWAGGAGTFFSVDPKEDMYIVFMTQSPKQLQHYRAVICDMIYAAIMK